MSVVNIRKAVGLVSVVNVAPCLSLGTVLAVSWLVRAV